MSRHVTNNASSTSANQSRRSSIAFPNNNNNNNNNAPSFFHQRDDDNNDDFNNGGNDTTLNGTLRNVSSIQHNKSGGATSNHSHNVSGGGGARHASSTQTKPRSGSVLDHQSDRLALPSGKQAPPPVLVSRNVLIDRYSALEKDSRLRERLYQRAANNTMPHTPTTLEREKTQRKRIVDPALRRKRVNADVPHEVSIGGVGRDLTLLTVVQQLDMNACGSDACALNVQQARHQHIDEVVAHSQSEFHWRRNPFAKVVPVDKGADATAAALVNTTAAQRRRQQEEEMRKQQGNNNSNNNLFAFGGDSATQDQRDEAEAQAQLQQVRDEFRVSRAVLTGALARSNVRTLPVTDQSLRDKAADIAPSDLANVKRAGALESKLRHRLHLLVEEERRQHYAEMYRSGELAKDDDMYTGSLDDPDAPKNPIILNRMASWQRLVLVGLFAQGLQAQVEEMKATKLLRRVFAREMYRYLRRKRVVHEREQFETKMKATAFTTASSSSGGGGGGGSRSLMDSGSTIPGAEVVVLTTVGPDGEKIERPVLRPSTMLLLKCFPVLKLDPDGYASPAVMLAAALAQRRGAPIAKVIGVNDDGIHGMPRMRISPEHLRRLASIFKPAVFRKKEPIIWSAPPPLQSSLHMSSSALYGQHRQPPPPPRSGNDTDWWAEIDDNIHLVQSGIVRMVFRHNRKQFLGGGAAAAAAAAVSGGGKDGGHPADGGATANANSKDVLSSSISRRCISGVETLTPGCVLGLEVLVPEQAKRFVAVADSDVATWCAPIKDFVAILDEINPYIDPEFDIENSASAARKRKNAALLAAAASSALASSGGIAQAPLLNSPEQILASRIERDCCLMLGRMLARTVMLRKQEIFLAQTPPTPAFLRSCAPLLHCWSDGGLTEICRALDAIFVEKGRVVPLRKDKPNRGYQWLYAGGSASVGPDIVIPPTTAPPSHVDYIYFVVHGAVAIMGRKVFESKRKEDGGGGGSPAGSSSPGGSNKSGGSQKLVLLDTLKPGQSFGVPSCLLGTLLDTAALPAICAALSASGTPASSAGKSAQSKAAAAAALVSSATGGNNVSAEVAIVANAAPVVLSAALATNILPSQLSHLVGVELHATQDAVLWKLSKNVLMHVLAHEHIGVVLSPYAMYQQSGKPPI